MTPVQLLTPKRKRRLKEVCKHGHAMTPENTWVKPSTGIRECRACRRAWRRAYRQTPKGKAGNIRHLLAWAQRQEAL